MQVAVVGHGVVGKAMAGLFKNKEVVVYDVGGDKDAVNECDLAIVCVPTPQKEDGTADVSAVEEVISWLETPLILIKSTVPPGTTEWLAHKYQKSICFSPEYIGESKYHTNYKYPHPINARSHEFMNIGGADCEKVWEFFKDEMCVDTRVGFSTATEAELAKYMENAFFATKVTFCNEFADICKSYGVEYDRVRELWLNDNRVNPMHTAVFKGKRGFGGKCYPKDVAAIVKDSGADTTLLQAVIEKNKKYD